MTIPRQGDMITDMKHSRLQHGTLSGYMDHRCRCKKCAEIYTLYMQEYRDTIFDETKAKKKDVSINLSDKDYSERVDNGF